MNFINGFLELFSDKGEFSVPLVQVIIFVVLNSFCLLLARYKLGLLISYCFVLFWGFISNREYFIDRFGNSTWGLIVYVMAGILMVITFIIGFFNDNRD